MWVMRQIVWICHRSWCTDPMWSHCLICISMTTSKLQHVLKCFLLLFSRSVMSDCLRPHGLRHTRLPCPSPSPGTSSNLCPLSQWCHPTISASVIPFSSCLQSFPASGSLLMSRLFASGGQSTEVSASTSVPLTNIQGSFPLGLTGLISLWSKESFLLLKSLLQHHSSKAPNVFFAGCIFYFVNDLCISSHTTLLGNPVTFGILNLRHFESRNVHGEEDT